MNDFWVFGYGSLMWQPGFAHLEVQKARIFGYRRILCIYSHIHRGTPERPGLVLGLDRGGSCIGMAFKVSGQLRAEVIDYLRQREMVGNVYFEKLLPATLEDGTIVPAIAYVADPNHKQYVGSIDAQCAAKHVAGSTGLSGKNEDYVLNTILHLRHLGIRDRWLESVAACLPDSMADHH